jgi:hypothetical protein
MPGPDGSRFVPKAEVDLTVPSIFNKWTSDDEKIVAGRKAEVEAAKLKVSEEKLKRKLAELEKAKAFAEKKAQEMEDMIKASPRNRLEDVE